MATERDLVSHAAGNAVLLAVDAEGCTSLCAAAKAGDSGAIEALLRQRDQCFGQNASQSLPGGGTSGTEKLQGRTNDPLEAQDPYGRTPLHHAVVRGHIASVRRLLAAGADVGASDVRGCRPLHLCSADAVVRMLLAAGADPALKNNRGQTAVEYMEGILVEVPSSLRTVNPQERLDWKISWTAVAISVGASFMIAAAVTYWLATYSDRQDIRVIEEL